MSFFDFQFPFLFHLISIYPLLRLYYFSGMRALFCNSKSKFTLSILVNSVVVVVVEF